MGELDDIEENEENVTLNDLESDIIKQEDQEMTVSAEPYNDNHNNLESKVHVTENDQSLDCAPYTPTKNLFCPHSDCYEYGEVFNGHSSFIMHMREHGNSKPYHGNQCDGRYTTIGNLNVHVDKIHKKKINYKCNECGKGFYAKTQWNDHCRVHKGIKYECNQCEQSFERKGDLNAHIRAVHNKEKRYECDECKLGFYEKKDLVRHYRIHTGEKPYECHICNRAFARRDVLQVHQRIHTGEKPYECTKCNK